MSWVCVTQHRAVFRWFFFLGLFLVTLDKVFFDCLAINVTVHWNLYEQKKNEYEKGYVKTSKMERKIKKRSRNWETERRKTNILSALLADCAEVYCILMAFFFSSKYCTFGKHSIHTHTHTLTSIIFKNQRQKTRNRQCCILYNLWWCKKRAKSREITSKWRKQQQASMKTRFHQVKIATASSQLNIVFFSSASLLSQYIAITHSKKSSEIYMEWDENGHNKLFLVLRSLWLLGCCGACDRVCILDISVFFHIYIHILSFRQMKGTDLVCG